MGFTGSQPRPGASSSLDYPEYLNMVREIKPRGSVAQFYKNRCGSPVRLLFGFRNKKFFADLSRTKRCNIPRRSEQAGAGRDQSQRIALVDEVNGCKKNVTNAQAIPLTSNESPEIGRANEGDSSLYVGCPADHSNLRM